MTTKHTPGPWEIIQDVGSIEKAIKASDGRLICEVLESDTSEKVWANALLIAASPTMYNQLERGAKLIERSIQHILNGRQEEAIKQLEAIIIDNTVSIKQAEGMRGE